MCRKTKRVPDSMTGQVRKTCETHPKVRLREGNGSSGCYICEEEKRQEAKLLHRQQVAV